MVNFSFINSILNVYFMESLNKFFQKLNKNIKETQKQENWLIQTKSFDYQYIQQILYLKQENETSKAIYIKRKQGQ